MDGAAQTQSCPHLSQVQPKTAFTIKSNCLECPSREGRCVCLSCNKVFCGLFSEHMTQHADKAKHPLALGFSDSSVWCYSCKNYVNGSQLDLVKNFVRRQKHAEMCSTLPTIEDVILELASPDEFYDDVPDWEAELGTPDEFNEFDW